MANNSSSSRTTTGLSVPQAQFPAANSPQRLGSPSGSVQSTGRNKVALKPGRSLMDWIRLGRSGNDLTSVGGRRLQVTKQELAKHNKPDDAWISLNGKVYNITPYMEFHPGGMDELMRGAGIDGTDLFNEVHKWVNYESMLEKCLIGKLVSDPRPSRPASTKSFTGLKPPSPIVPKPLQPSTNDTTAVDGVITVDGGERPQTTKQNPRHDWFQSNATVTVVIYTKWKNMTDDRILIDKTDKDFQIVAFIEDHSLKLHWELEDSLQSDYEVKVSGTSGKVEVTLQKCNPGKQWTSIGEPMTDHSTFQKIANREMKYRQCVLKQRDAVSHDTQLLCFEVPQGTRLCVPVGYHVFVKATVCDTEIVRPYTVVLPSILTDDVSQDIRDGRLFYLMIKIYQSGVLTPVIDKLNIGDKISISDPDGSFLISKLEACQRLFLLAAGTGFTPMVRLIHSSLQLSKDNRKVQLMFFNKTEKDILWQDQLEKLKADQRFESTYILSEPSGDWQGPTGRIRKELLDNHLAKPSPDAQSLVCVCGPTPFTKTTIQLLADFGYKDEDTHAFLA
ncbi:cytochrome b5 reductase 4-like [Ptychodera flava]|uniref:cytochrome b5 reductase 4-like n=1 Tax=Ptychodera flava TaxID=63121 RepID=UPI00396A2F06